MGILLVASRIYVPGFIQGRKLFELFSATAAAFDSPMPRLKGLSIDEYLTQYALFTRENAEKAIAQKNEFQIRNRLYQNAYRLGHSLKADFKIKTREEAMQMSQVIYKILRIEFRGDPQGNILIKKCFFSHYYSGDVCSVVSSLDEGLLAGLSGGGKLSFSQRITEGHECCRAQLLFERVAV